MCESRTDFLIQPTRAPKARTNVTSFQSRLSEREWKGHQSVTEIHNTSTDPEAIVVIARPTDVDTFLKLKGWIEGLQQELDRLMGHSWRNIWIAEPQQFNFLGLKIRRVKSSIDDVPSFATTVTYVPAKIAFEAANADLLKLLVAPLYSNKPGTGLRELFQNAIDAVREFNDLVARHPELSSVDRYAQAADVTLDCYLPRSSGPVGMLV